MVEWHARFSCKASTHAAQLSAALELWLCPVLLGCVWIPESGDWQPNPVTVPAGTPRARRPRPLLQHRCRAAQHDQVWDCPPRPRLLRAVPQELKLDPAKCGSIWQQPSQGENLQPGSHANLRTRLLSRSARSRLSRSLSLSERRSRPQSNACLCKSDRRAWRECQPSLLMTSCMVEA